MKNKISFCISCKNRSFQKVYWDGKFRNEYFEDIPRGYYTLRLLPNCLKSIHDSQIDNVEYEVILSDFSSQDTKYEDWLSKTLKNIPYKLIDMGSIFNKGKGLNAAAKIASGDVLFFLDTDMIISDKLIDQSLEILNREKAFFPICKSYKDPLHQHYWVRETGYGNLVIWKHVFQDNGPWLEREVYGLEDDEMWFRLKEIAHREIGVEFYHQWHPAGEAKSSFGGKFSREHYRYDLPNGKNSTLFYQLNTKAKNNPLISVVIYIENDLADIDKILNSIENQTYENYEIILIVGKSSENIDIFRKKYTEVQLLTLSTTSASYAYNAGIKAAKGDYLVFLQSTDVLLTRALETNIKYFITYPECAFIAGNYIRKGKTRNDIDEDSEKINKDQYIKLLHYNHIGPLSSVMFKREIFDYVGLFDERLNKFYDYDMYLRIVKDYSLFHHEEEIAEHRKNGQYDAITFKKYINEINLVYQKQITINKKKGDQGIIGYIKKKIKVIYKIIFNKKYELYEYDVRRAARKGCKHYKDEYTISAIMKIQHDENGSLLPMGIIKTLLFLLRHNPASLPKLLLTKGR